MSAGYQESVIEIGYKGVLLTFDILSAIIKQLLETRQNNTLTHGEQTMKQLNEHGRELENVKIPDKDIKAFKKELNRHGVDFAVMKDKSVEGFSIFFKGQDVNRIYEALEKTVDKAVVEQNKNAIKPMQEVFKEAKQEAEQRAQEKALDQPDKSRSANRGQEL